MRRISEATKYRHRKQGYCDLLVRDGRANHPLYNTWKSIRVRCYNDKFPQYSDYGGRGIRMCGRWFDYRHGFWNFAEDMGPKPSPRHTLDRINNEGNYEPNNCRWATYSQQNKNRRPDKTPRQNKSGHKGVEILSSGNYRVKVWNGHRQVSLGTVETIEEAVVLQERYYND